MLGVVILILVPLLDAKMMIYFLCYAAIKLCSTKKLPISIYFQFNSTRYAPLDDCTSGGLFGQQFKEQRFVSFVLETGTVLDGKLESEDEKWI